MVTDAASTSTGTASTSAGASAASLAMQERSSVLRTLDTHTTVRQKNTTRNYAPKQAEFKRFCDEKGYEEMTRYQVTPEKAHLFLEERVLTRPSKRRKKGTADDLVPTLSESSVRLYVAALVDVYLLNSGLTRPYLAPRAQKSADADEDARLMLVTGEGWWDGGYTDVQQHEINTTISNKPTESTRRLILVMALFAFFSAIERFKSKPERSASTALDGYTIEQLHDLSDYFIQRNSETGLRDRLAFLISHFALLRGENARNLELPERCGCPALR
ncbi:hypothetical protein V8E36_001339 [Tilletia maclaganii]